MTDAQDVARRPESTQAPHSMTPLVVRGEPSTGATRDQLSFTPRWGRLTVALVGLLALCSALVTLVLGIAGVVSPLVPLACIGLTAAAVAVLRFLAIRSRRARVERAFAEAMAPIRDTGPLRPLPVAPPVPQRPTVLFDAEEDGARPLTAMERRTAALAAAHGSSAVVPGGGELSGGAAAPRATGATAWAPVDVPRPTYVDAAKAERQAPAPLDLPEAPKPTSRTPIKTSEAAARVAATTTDSGELQTDPAPATGRINLDDVLQRRRA